MEESGQLRESIPEKLPREWEMIVTAFLPNMRQIENRFDRIDIEIRDLHVGQRDISNRMGLLEKRMDNFEMQIDKRFEQVDKRFEQVDKRFEQVDKRFDLVDKRFEQIEKRFENVDRRFDQIAASIERLGDKIDARDARQRSFTMRMFGIAITISFLGVLGVFMKTFGIM